MHNLDSGVEAGVPVTPEGDAVKLSPLPDLSSPGASTVSDELTPVFAPMKLVLEPAASLKFLLLGLMGCTQAFAGLARKLSLIHI